MLQPFDAQKDLWNMISIYLSVVTDWDQAAQVAGTNSTTTVMEGAQDPSPKIKFI